MLTLKNDQTSSRFPCLLGFSERYGHGLIWFWCQMRLFCLTCPLCCCLCREPTWRSEKEPKERSQTGSDSAQPGRGEPVATIQSPGMLDICQICPEYACLVYNVWIVQHKKRTWEKQVFHVCIVLSEYICANAHPSLQVPAAGRASARWRTRSSAARRTSKPPPPPPLHPAPAPQPPRPVRMASPSKWCQPRPPRRTPGPSAAQGEEPAMGTAAPPSLPPRGLMPCPYKTTIKQKKKIVQALASVWQRFSLKRFL